MTQPETIPCPRDGATLACGHFENVAVHRCIQCDGILLAQNQLNAMLSAMAELLVPAADTEAVVEPVLDAGGALGCPHCATGMERYGYMGSNQIMIDCCAQCMALWIDPDELAGMSMMYARAESRRQAQHQTRQEFTRDVEKLPVNQQVHYHLDALFELDSWL